jgi:predicted nucleotidyltransferase
MSPAAAPLLSQTSGLPPAALAAIRQVLAAHPEVEQAILYGSRGLGRHRPASDVDLALIGPAISAGSLARIEADLDALRLPWVIDLSRLDAIAHPALLAHNERVGQLLFQRANPCPSPPWRLGGLGSQAATQIAAGEPRKPTSMTDAALQQMAAEIREEIPDAEVRLFGSHARGKAGPGSDVDLLITVTDEWLAHHDRWAVLDRLRWRLSQPRRPVDLLLFSRSQVEQRRKLRSSVVHQAYTHGRRLDG